MCPSMKHLVHNQNTRVFHIKLKLWHYKHRDMRSAGAEHNLLTLQDSKQDHIKTLSIPLTQRAHEIFGIHQQAEGKMDPLQLT